MDFLPKIYLLFDQNTNTKLQKTYLLKLQRHNLLIWTTVYVIYKYFLKLYTHNNLIQLWIPPWKLQNWKFEVILERSISSVLINGVVSDRPLLLVCGLSVIIIGSWIRSRRVIWVFGVVFWCYLFSVCILNNSITVFMSILLKYSSTFANEDCFVLCWKRCPFIKSPSQTELIIYHYMLI